MAAAALGAVPYPERASLPDAPYESPEGRGGMGAGAAASSAADAARAELVSSAHCLLRTAAYCLLPTAHCPLPTAHCPLPTAHPLPPTHYSLLTTTYTQASLACVRRTRRGVTALMLACRLREPEEGLVAVRA